MTSFRKPAQGDQVEYYPLTAAQPRRHHPAHRATVTAVHGEKPPWTVDVHVLAVGREDYDRAAVRFVGPNEEAPADHAYCCFPADVDAGGELPPASA